DGLRQRSGLTGKLEAGAARYAGPPLRPNSYRPGSFLMAVPLPDERPEAPVFVATGVEKTFDRTRAPAGASLELRAGEVHGLLGANGAGKSTLSKVISGHVVRDAGTLLYKGQPLEHRSTREALEAGIAIVMQETSLAPDLTVLENMFLP